MEFVRRHLSYSNIAATLALVFAMSGGALAATHYLINSTKQINPKVLNALRAGTGATGANGANGAAGAAGAQGSQGPAGPTGNTGPEGPKGLDGNAKEGKEGKEGPPGQEGKEGKEGKEGGHVGPWIPITSHSKLKEVTGFEELGVRTESAGATARLRGVLEVISEVHTTTEPLFIIPVGERPCKNLEFGDGVSFGGGSNHVGSLAISAETGAVTDPEVPVPAGNRYLLDGITWDVPPSRNECLN
jgi:hypothetical protein